MEAAHAHRAPRGVWAREGGPDATVSIVSTMRSTFHNFDQSARGVDSVRGK
jgi:hypothetical protein